MQDLSSPNRDRTHASWNGTVDSYHWAAREVPVFDFFFNLFLFFLVLPVYCYQPVTLHPHAHVLSHVTPWTAACQAPLSMDFSRQEYWSGLPLPSPCAKISATAMNNWVLRDTGCLSSVKYQVKRLRVSDIPLNSNTTQFNKIKYLYSTS